MKTLLLTAILVLASTSSFASVEKECTTIPEHMTPFFNDKSCVQGDEFINIFTTEGSEIFDQAEEAFIAGSIACKTNEHKYSNSKDQRIKKAFYLGCKNPKHK